MVYILVVVAIMLLIVLTRFILVKRRRLGEFIIDSRCDTSNIKPCDADEVDNSMVATILEKNGYHIEIDPVDEEYIKDFYCDNLSEKQLKDTQWVNEFKTLHSEWTVSWNPAEVKKNA